MIDVVEAKTEIRDVKKTKKKNKKKKKQKKKKNTPHRVRSLTSENSELFPRFNNAFDVDLYVGVISYTTRSLKLVHNSL